MPLQSTFNPKKPYVRSDLSWRENLVQQVTALGEKDPKRAWLLHRKILFCDWTYREVQELRREGLDVSRVALNRGLPGGMEAGGELAIKLIATAIEMLADGNKKEMLEEAGSAFVEAFAINGDERVRVGTREEEFLVRG